MSNLSRYRPLSQPVSPDDRRMIIPSELQIVEVKNTKIDLEALNQEHIVAQPKLAAQLYTVREFTKTFEGFKSSMQKVSDIGYTAVQVSAIGPIPHEDVKRIADDLNLTICNTHIPYDQLWNELDSVIEQHKLWDCQHVAIGSLPQEYREDGADGYKRFAQEASTVGEKLHNAGLTFSYHNHSFEFVRFPHSENGASSRTALEIIYDESDPRFLQAEIDTYWVQHGGGDQVTGFDA